MGTRNDTNGCQTKLAPIGVILLGEAIAASPFFLFRNAPAYPLPPFRIDISQQAAIGLPTSRLVGGWLGRPAPF